MDGYILFRKEARKARWWSSLYVRQQPKCIKLCLGVDEGGAKSLWIRIKGKVKMGVYYRPPN